MSAVEGELVRCDYCGGARPTDGWWEWRPRPGNLFCGIVCALAWEHRPLASRIGPDRPIGRAKTRCSECGGVLRGRALSHPGFCRAERRRRRRRRSSSRCAHAIAPVAGERWRVRDDARPEVAGLVVLVVWVAHDELLGCRVGGHVVGRRGPRDGYAIPLVAELAGPR